MLIFNLILNLEFRSPNLNFMNDEVILSLKVSGGEPDVNVASRYRRAKREVDAAAVKEGLV